ncbi:Transposase [Roseibium album]|uniref:Transposase n=1 Tax=Roseibium album TaxID=311410 RepID=A0A0M7AV55_9HYPH|nr:Transposase [Roseibium album]CTQ77673.1 Transposase [Roseibium album]CTQ79669.1 Transposase [Roseibium album]
MAANGAQTHAQGRARGGPGTKIHALSDNRGRPIAFHLTGANVPGFTGAEALLPLVPENGVPHGNKGYDSDRIRRTVEARGSLPNIPSRKIRRWKNWFSPHHYKGRNVIERMFGRLKEFRRIATRYDRNARNFLSALCFAATVCYWL